MKKLCIFDLDGTLVDSIADIAFAVNRGLRTMGLPEQPTENFYRFVGNGMYKLCERALPNGRKDCTEMLQKLYAEYYVGHCCVLTRPYDGIIETVDKIKTAGIKTAVLSNKPHEQTMNVVNTLFGTECFDYVLGQIPEFPVKPDPSAIKYVMKELGVTPADTVNIGDSDVDIILGRNAGTEPIGVSWGFRGTEELKAAGCVKIAAAPSELYELIIK